MTAALHPAAVHRPNLRPGGGRDWERAQCSAFNIWTSPIQGSRPFCPEVADPGSPISCPETLIEWQMVIFWGARSCGLPAARGLRPQAPAVLPRPCQQGAGRQRQQAARWRGGDGGLRPNARLRTRWVSKGLSGRAGDKPLAPIAPFPASQANRPTQGRPKLGLGPWKAAEKGQNFSPSVPEGPYSSNRGPRASRSGIRAAWDR